MRGVAAASSFAWSDRASIPTIWKPMASVGAGVREIRIHTELAHRVLYLATFDEAVYVLHAFEKRTRKTPPQELKLARDRYRALLKKRAEDAKKRQPEDHAIERQRVPRSRLLRRRS
jgi:hypothetical protein